MPTIVEPQPTNPDVRLRAQIKALETRIAALERGVPLPVITGAPSAANGPDGAMAADRSATNKLWVRIDGLWRSVTVT